MNILIIDDEPLPAKYLEELINQNYSRVTICKILNDPIEALEYVRDNKFDLIFLDVEMPKMTGIEFVKHASLDYSTSVVFTTAYENYALDAFRSNAIHYMVKPIEIEELMIAIQKTEDYLKIIKPPEEKKKECLTVFDGDDYRVLSYDEIIRLQADGSYTKVFLKGEYVLVTKRLGEVFKDLSESDFVRCHKSHVVNLSKIQSVNRSENSIKLKDGSEVPFSNSNRKKMLEIVNL